MNHPFTHTSSGAPPTQHLINPRHVSNPKSAGNPLQLCNDSSDPISHGSTNREWFHTLDTVCTSVESECLFFDLITCQAILTMEWLPADSRQTCLECCTMRTDPMHGHARWLWPPHDHGNEHGPVQHASHDRNASQTAPPG